MPLPPPNLDDRTFQDIVDEAKRLIPRLTPEWTNHNVSDPGVALIELFAWMSEMVMFRLNQVPERLYVHFLNMIGIEPFPPAAARARLTFSLTGTVNDDVTVPQGTQVTTTAGAGAVDGSGAVFATTRELRIRQPELITAATQPAGDDRVTDVWDDLRFGTEGIVAFTTPLTAEAEMTPGDVVAFGFGASLADHVIRLTIEAEADGIGVDPRDPPVRWEAWNGEGWIETPALSDTTGGLNRPGAVVLLMPDDHALLTLGRRAAYWVRARLTAPRRGQPTYRSSPRVRSVVVHAVGASVEARHARPVAGEVLGRSNGAPGQEFAVREAPILPREAGEIVEVDDVDGTTAWTEVADFAASGPRDRHYVWDASSGLVRFGPRVRYPDGSDRQHGRVPRDGAQIRVTGYHVGGGSAGNVPARTLTVMRSSIPYVGEVVNVAAATGGVDAETVEEAKIRGPLSLRTGARAVTAGDFERLTLESTIGVARARCLPPERPGGPVRVLVVPRLRTEVQLQTIDDFALDPALSATVQHHLDEHRLVGTSVEVSTPFYQGVSVVALVHAGAGRPVALVRQRAIEALATYLNPLTGGVDGNGWPFDADLNSAVVSQLLESVEGVERVEEALLFEFDLRTGHRLGAARDVVRLGQDSLFLSASHQVIVR